MPISEVYNEDCLQGMKRYPDKFFDLAIVDPPYGVGNFAQGKRKKKPHNRNWKIEWNNKTPDEIYFSELLRVSKNYILWGENYYKEFIHDPGTIVWDKGNSSDVGSQAELACTNLFTRVVVYFEQWTGFINSEGIKGTEKIHPCQKPITLYKWLLKNYAKPGDKILDTHLGSQSSRIAAYDMGFHFTGFEIDVDYFNAGNKRFEDFKKQLKLF
jgi:site-specific DNA-methyltransferase (adenine-specific)